MVRKHTVLLGAMLVMVALLVGGRLSEFSLTRPAQAQSAKSPEPRKWEYCTIVGVSFDRSWNTSSARVAFLTPTGQRVETLDCGSSSDPLASAFAKLGSGGWEVVGQVMYNNQSPEYRPDTWLFKRPTP